ncbi:MAG: hypothetical protein AB1555_03250 [Nitrospirota bacterium]
MSSTHSRPGTGRPAAPAGRAGAPYGTKGATGPIDQYGSFQASLLYCPHCHQATPTRERLLLVLPSGNLYEYLCTRCGTSTGSKTDNQRVETELFRP